MQSQLIDSLGATNLTNKHESEMCLFAKICAVGGMEFTNKPLGHGERPASLCPKDGDSRCEGCQPSRKRDCDVKRNRFERHGGLDVSFNVNFWVKAGSQHYGASISKTVRSDSLCRVVWLSVKAVHSPFSLTHSWYHYPGRQSNTT